MQGAVQLCEAWVGRFSPLILLAVFLGGLFFLKHFSQCFVLCICLFANLTVTSVARFINFLQHSPATSSFSRLCL